MNASWPREGDATAAVEAAARALYEAERKRMRDQLTPNQWRALAEWDDLAPVERFNLCDTVLPIVWAALSALPDPRHGVWEEGRQAERLGGDNVTNPYPSGA